MCNSSPYFARDITSGVEAAIRWFVMVTSVQLAMSALGECALLEPHCRIMNVHSLQSCVDLAREVTVYLRLTSNIPSTGRRRLPRYLLVDFKLWVQFFLKWGSTSHSLGVPKMTCNKSVFNQNVKNCIATCSIMHKVCCSHILGPNGFVTILKWLTADFSPGGVWFVISELA